MARDLSHSVAVGGSLLHCLPQAAPSMMRRAMRAAMFALAVLSPGMAQAAATGSYAVQYDGYSHGLIALKLSASVTLTPTGYSGRLAFHTAGLIGFVSHVETDSTVTGRFEGDRAVPLSFASTGILHGINRLVSMHWQNAAPVVDQIAPPVEQERTPVPEAMRPGSIDALSAMAQLLRQAGTRGSCDGTAKTFEGRRLTELAAQTGGRETPPRSVKSPFDAPAVRCDFTGEELAGFLLREPEADQRKPRKGVAWLADLVPGAPPVPERVMFDHKLLGQVTLYLTSVTGAPGPVAQIKPAAPGP